MNKTLKTSVKSVAIALVAGFALITSAGAAAANDTPWIAPVNPVTPPAPVAAAPANIAQ
ncbi:hypothetical protein [Streptomyces sp. NBC_00503]|uniref:hypothetical protein n=1 Tax=Streptomyces sp. NBC_00503 TaxID=2903659 RepID=UPI002E80B5A6|nr:hypothetical protein [Streptomyces sp. NBC_00503]WUD84364.1 hypothetical protein OG490_29515 [Streptomyces sp. NBC_00503]